MIFGPQYQAPPRRDNLELALPNPPQPPANSWLKLSIRREGGGMLVWMMLV